MTGYLARRLIHAALVIWGAVTIVFIVVRLIPGDPALVLLGPSATQAEVDALRVRLGLDQPIIIQYASFLGDAIRLDFGDSTRLDQPALGLVAQRLPDTATLAAAGMSLALVLSFPLGILAARRRGRTTDRVITMASLIGQSLPPFWVGIMLVLLFSRWLQVLPSGGTGGIDHLLMPAIALALPMSVSLIRLVRGGLIDVLGEGYIATARSKGLRERDVVNKHAVRNMLIPVVTVIGLQLGDLLAGVVIIEMVFSWPGMGRLLVDSIFARDYAVVQAAVMFIAVIYIVVNLFVDVLYGYLDPRIRVGQSA